MRKLIFIISIIVGLFFIGCGGSDTETTKVSGRVVDGPINGAKVEIVDINNSNNILATTKTDEKGNFIVEVGNLPDSYKIVARGGEDTGVDGEVNENDKNSSFNMEAIVDKESGDNSKAIVSPATTLISKIVEEGQMPKEEAEKRVNNSFGLNENSSLAEIDPIVNVKANRVTNLIALLVKITPSNDKDAVFKSFAKVVIKEKIKVKITDLSTKIEKLNLTDIADEVKIISPNSISQEDIYKLEKVSSLVKSKIVTTIENSKPIKLSTLEDKKEAIAKNIALDKLIENTLSREVDEIDLNELELITNNIEKGMKRVLDGSDLNSSDEDTSDLISRIIENNLDKDVEKISNSLIKVSKEFKVVKKFVIDNDKIKFKISVKNIIKSLFIYTNFDKIDDISNSLRDETILTSLDETAKKIEDRVANEDEETKKELKNELEDTLSSQIANIVDKNNTIIETGLIKEATNKTIDNNLFVETIKKSVKIQVSIKNKEKQLKRGEKLSAEDRASLISSKVVINNIKVNIKINNFTEETAKNSDELYKLTLNSIQQSYQNNLKELEDKIKALQLTIINLNNSLNTINYNNSINNSFNTIQNIKNSSGNNYTKIIYNNKTTIINNFINNGGKENEEDEKRKPITTLPTTKIDQPKVKTYIIPEPKIESLPVSDKLEIEVKYLED